LGGGEDKGEWERRKEEWVKGERARSGSRVWSDEEGYE
jgi:hypothetical protein